MRSTSRRFAIRLSAAGLALILLASLPLPSTTIAICHKHDGGLALETESAPGLCDCETCRDLRLGQTAAGRRGPQAPVLEPAPCVHETVSVSVAEASFVRPGNTRVASPEASGSTAQEDFRSPKAPEAAPARLFPRSSGPPAEGLSVRRC